VPQPTVVPSEDSHHSEYIAACDARREFLTGFTGSAGCAVVTADIAALATDGRYFNQASKQLDQNWTLLKQGLPDVPSWQDWTAEQSSGGKTVAVDPSLIPATTAAKLSDKIKRSGGAGLRAIDDNLVDIVWGAHRPTRPCLPITVQPHQFAGSTVRGKLEQVRQMLSKRNSLALAVSTLDDIAWLYNLRGGDIPFNPVFFSYAIITNGCAKIYVEESKLTSDCRRHLQDNAIEVRNYSSIFDDCRALFESSLQTNTPSTVTPCQRFTISNKTSWALKLALGGDEAVDDIRSPIGDLKAVKNDVEISGMRACHLRDGAALVEYLAWLEDQLVVKNAVLDEVTAADKLEQLRAKQQYYVGLSFATVSATGAK
jgi:Xaa-Pro aminopeptidase